MGWVKKVETYLSKWSSPAVRKEAETANAKIKSYIKRKPKRKKT